MKIQTSLKLVAFAASVLLAATHSAGAQSMPLSIPDNSPGLIGQTYTGLELGYVHHIESAPRALHQYGFVTSRPIPEELNNVDAAFHYDYTSGSSFGEVQHRHDIAAGLTRYWTQGDVTPFLVGDIGWAWSKTGTGREGSFTYRAGVGAQLLASPRVTITPSVDYRSAQRFHDRSWNFGVKLTRRFDRVWSGTFGVLCDDASNVDFAFGVQRRY